MTKNVNTHRRGVVALLSFTGAVAMIFAAASAFAQHMGADAGARGDDNKGSIELVDPNVLRVCADPNNLPFSNEKGAGFENKIAEFLAKKLGKELTYAFYPGATGFVRNTLNAHLCDVILGIPQGNDLVQPTNPYYRTTYAIVTRAGGGRRGQIGQIRRRRPDGVLDEAGDHPADDLVNQPAALKTGPPVKN